MEDEASKEAQFISETIDRAIRRAIENGYEPVALETMLFQRSRTAGKSHTMQIWAKGLLFDKDFARALFGSESVDDNGSSVSGIEFWAKQVAVDIEGKIRAIPDSWNQPTIAYVVMPEIDLQEYTDKAPIELVEATKVVADIKHMMATIPFRTHSIKRVRVYGTVPAYEYHLKQMAVSPNPFTYVSSFIDDNL